MKNVKQDNHKLEGKDCLLIKSERKKNPFKEGGESIKWEAVDFNSKKADYVSFSNNLDTGILEYLSAKGVSKKIKEE